MKRKFYYAASAVVLLVVSAVNIYASEEAENQISDIVMANIEALTDGEGGGASGNIVDCYSSSEGKKGATYYDCGTCTKQTNAKGTGNSRTCVVK